MAKKEINDVQALILAILRDGGRLHGLDIMERAEERAGRAYSGSLYRGLHQLEEVGLVRAEWEMRDGASSTHKGPPRRYYWMGARALEALDDYIVGLNKKAKLVVRGGTIDALGNEL